MDGARKVSLVEKSLITAIWNELYCLFQQEFYWGFDWIQKDNKLRIKLENLLMKYSYLFKKDMH